MKKLNSQGTVLTEFSRRTQGPMGSGPTVPSMINKVAYEINDNSSSDAGRDGGIGTR